MNETECDHSNTFHQDGMLVCRECGMETCEHLETDEMDGMNVCIICGEELTEISYEKDWRFYGGGDTKSKSDPSRCHRRRDDTKSIYEYVGDKNFMYSIIANANEKYMKILANTQRVKNKKAIITMCLYAAYIDEKEPRTLQEIGAEFGLNKKNISKASEVFYEQFPQYRNVYIEPSDLLRRILIKTGIHMSHYVKIRKMCKFVEENGVNINNSNPQSVACAVTFLYLRMCPEVQDEIGLTKSKFTTIVGMSDITITKICKNALSVLGINEELKI